MTIENAFIECLVSSACPVHPKYFVNAILWHKSFHLPSVFSKLIVQFTLTIHDPSIGDGERDGQLQRVIPFILG